MKIQYCIYKRVSSTAQGISGLGLEAQGAAIARFLTADNEVVAEFTEIESGKRSDRPELAKAIALCKQHGYTLLVAKLDRLARNLHFVTSLQQAKINFVAVDNPHATPLMIHILCAFAEAEAVAISSRTKAALEQCKQRGVKLGNPNPQQAVKLANRARQHQADAFSERLLPVIQEIKSKACVSSYRGIAEILNVRGLKSANGKLFSPQTVKNILNRPISV